MTVPLFCVALAYALVWVPRLVVTRAQALQPEGYDNAHPRDQQARLEGWGKRAQAAHMNAFEAFAPFAASVFVAHLGKADAAWTARLAVAFVALRCVYTFAYIGNVPTLRSLVWLAGTGCTTALFLLPLFAG